MDMTAHGVNIGRIMGTTYTDIGRTTAAYSRKLQSIAHRAAQYGYSIAVIHKVFPNLRMPVITGIRLKQEIVQRK